MVETNKAYEGKGISLESIRVGIDECDKQIIQILARRFGLALEVGKYKAIRNLPVLDKARETQLLADRRRQASEAGNYSMGEIFKLILEESRRIQTKVIEELKADKPDR